MRLGSKVPSLRTVGRTVRSFGTILMRFGSKVPFLRTHGRTVRRIGTMGRSGATHIRRPAAEEIGQASEVACIWRPCTLLRRFLVSGRPETS